MIKKNIIYIGDFRFPNLDAAAKRVHSIGSVCRELGYNVVFAGGQTGKEEQFVYDEFSCFSMNELDLNNVGVLSKVKAFFRKGNNTTQWLENHIKKNKIHKIIIYNSSNIFIKKVINFCNRNNIELICDITEWYDSSHLPGGKYGLVSIDNYLKMHYTYKTIEKKIVISSFLSNFYKDRKSKNIVVPPLFVESNKQYVSKKIEKKIHLLYAGNPGKKDNIVLILKIYMLYKDKLPNLVFNILGVTQENFQREFDLTISGDIIFYGRVSYKKVLDTYKKSHFSFLLRDDLRYANAGFPTKFVESFSENTPVVANITSDLGKYLEDGKNGFVIKNFREDTIFQILLKINNINNESYLKMQKNAFETSEKFYYKEYSQVVKSLIIE